MFIYISFCFYIIYICLVFVFLYEGIYVFVTKQISCLL